MREAELSLPEVSELDRLCEVVRSGVVLTRLFALLAEAQLVSDGDRI